MCMALLHYIKLNFNYLISNVQMIAVIVLRHKDGKA